MKELPKMLSFGVLPELYQEIRKEAFSREISVAELIRRILTDHFEEQQARKESEVKNV